RRDREVLEARDVGARKAVERIALVSRYLDRLREGHDRLRAAFGDSFFGRVVTRAAVDHDACRSLGHRRDRWVAVNDDVRLYLVARSFGRRREVEQALAVGRRKRRDVYERLDLL